MTAATPDLESAEGQTTTEGLRVTGVGAGRRIRDALRTRKAFRHFDLQAAPTAAAGARHGAPGGGQLGRTGKRMNND
jgi:hypothetical protein